MEQKELKSLGWANAWSAIPPEVLEARQKEYEIQEETVGRCIHRYTCLEGGWYYMEDSSD